MIEGPYIAEAAALMGDPARANMLSAMMDGRARTASELAYVAGVSPQTASGHLSKLAEGQMVAVEKQGRHRYYRLANQDVARALEALMVVATTGVPRHRPTGPRDEQMRFARTCYDHLAGRVGVGLTNALIEKGLVRVNEDSFSLTRKGEKDLQEFGLDIDALKVSRRAFASRCLDWSERTPHMGGALGAALLAQLESRKWISRKKDSRTVEVTREGRAGLYEQFGVSLDD
ncbi:MAG: winged helix-turn-helix domain-containing protein [Hyphomicrobiaceae bacterium]|nr:winged helix-turn-helix domain-containing protein [Hyphomicrobiaceae bacterium]